MTEDDRKKIFWYLQRKTSYTAWKREADAFDRFAAIFKQQVEEQPNVPGFMGPTNWEPLYVPILKCQVLYEKALARLLQGDRTIFLYNDLGLLHDAWAGHNWHKRLVADVHFAGGQVAYDGKYVPALTQAIEAFFACSEDAGYLEPRKDGTPAQESWTTFWYDVYKTITFPDPLYTIPTTKKEVLIRTGEVAPVFGIYEPQIKDGCMNYLLGSVPAPLYETTDGTYSNGTRPVFWRLIWEDDRYLDGHIPGVEVGYFPPKLQAPAVTSSTPDTPLTATSGQACPKAGKWAVIDALGERAHLQKDQAMPPYRSHDVAWVWVED